MDYIRRDDVHDIIAKVYSGYLTDETRDCLSDIDCEVAEMQSWIPTAERLPENDTEVLYCDEHEVIGTCHFWNGFNKFKHSDGEHEMTDIVAWMYLPESFKGVSEC